MLWWCWVGIIHEFILLLCLFLLWFSLCLLFCRGQWRRLILIIIDLNLSILRSSYWLFVPSIFITSTTNRSLIIIISLRFNWLLIPSIRRWNRFSCCSLYGLFIPLTSFPYWLFIPLSRGVLLDSGQGFFIIWI